MKPLWYTLIMEYVMRLNEFQSVFMEWIVYVLQFLCFGLYGNISGMKLRLSNEHTLLHEL